MCAGTEGGEGRTELAILYLLILIFIKPNQEEVDIALREVHLVAEGAIYEEEDVRSGHTPLSRHVNQPERINRIVLLTFVHKLLFMHFNLVFELAYVG